VNSEEDKGTNEGVKEEELKKGKGDHLPEIEQQGKTFPINYSQWRL